MILVLLSHERQNAESTWISWLHTAIASRACKQEGIVQCWRNLASLLVLQSSCAQCEILLPLHFSSYKIYKQMLFWPVLADTNLVLLAFANESMYGKIREDLSCMQLWWILWPENFTRWGGW